MPCTGTPGVAEAARFLIPTVDTIPPELKDQPQWVAWRDGSKIPLNPRTGREASSTDPRTWGTFAEAVTRYHATGTGGVGFVFSQDDPYVGVDLDHCRNPETEAVEPWAQQIVSDLDSYTELSPSGTGIHIIIKGKKPGARCKAGKLEMYYTGRYFTVTGHLVEGPPASVEDRQTELDALYEQTFGAADVSEPDGNGKQPTSPDLSDEAILDKLDGARNGEKFAHLYRGDDDGYPSASEGDLAMLGILTFYSQDREQLDRIFRASGRMRDKWDERHGQQTYGEKTIAKALSNIKETYSGVPRCGGVTDPAAHPVDLPRLDGPLDLALVVDGAARCPTRQTLSAVVLLNGEDVGTLSATSTDKGLTAAVGKLARIIEDGTGRKPTHVERREIEAWLSKLMRTESVVKLVDRIRDHEAAATTVPRGPLAVDLICEAIIESKGIAFKDPSDGTIWSEVEGRGLRQSEFMNTTPRKAIAAVKGASDFMPSPTDPHKAVKVVRLLLPVVWSALWEELPVETGETGLNVGSKRAAKFRISLIALLTRLSLWRRRPQDETRQHYSIGGLLRERQTHPTETHWTPIANASAWVRQRGDQREDCLPWLAISYPLIGQLSSGGYGRAEIGGVQDQRSLAMLADRYGCEAVGENVPSNRLRGGRNLLVLSPAIVSEIADGPEDEK